MNEVFADTFYYIALLNPADHFHAAAIQATQALTSRLVTTAWVLTEVADALSAPAVRQRTYAFLTGVTYCISIEVRTERGITDALTGDHHFVQAGFWALLL